MLEEGAPPWGSSDTGRLCASLRILSVHLTGESGIPTSPRKICAQRGLTGYMLKRKQAYAPQHSTSQWTQILKYSLEQPLNNLKSHHLGWNRTTRLGFYFFYCSKNCGKI